jgi:hypothetical protein
MAGIPIRRALRTGECKPGDGDKASTFGPIRESVKRGTKVTAAA